MPTLSSQLAALRPNALASLRSRREGCGWNTTRTKRPAHPACRTAIPAIPDAGIYSRYSRSIRLMPHHNIDNEGRHHEPEPRKHMSC